MRLPRLFAPGQVQLVQVRFAPAVARCWQEQAGKSLLDDMSIWFGEYAKAHQLALHAWSLSPAQLLFLGTAMESTAISRTVQAIGRRLAAALKTGNVFEGRYKSALIDAAWVVPAQIWLECAPVQDGYVAQAAAWPWSSAAGHTGDNETPKPSVVALTDHPSYWACGNTPFDRQASYRASLAEGLTPDQCEKIQAAVSGQWALGSPRFIEQLGKIANRRVVPSKRGRPRKTKEITTDTSLI